MKYTSEIKILKADEKSSRELTSISFAAKKYWGYPDEYFKIWEQELTITPEYIRQNKVYLAVLAEEIVGFYSIIEINTQFYLDHLFLKPTVIGKGIGSKLIQHLLVLAKEEGIQTLKIYVDPNAEGFYQKMGANFLELVESSIKGRMLPIYMFHVEKLSPFPKSKALVILLSEIYGVNEHMELIEDLLQKEGFAVICPNLLAREAFPYSEEAEAYNYFINKIGFENSCNEVKKLVQHYRSQYQSIFLLGFSVGATTAWLSSQLDVEGIVGFYGSRIRDFTELQPLCPTLLIFASEEKSFNVQELAEKLAGKNKVKTVILKGQHGFADPFSSKYDDTLFQNSKELMLNFFSICISK